MFSLKKHEYLLFSGNRARDYFTGKGESVHYHQVKNFVLLIDYIITTNCRQNFGLQILENINVQQVVYIKNSSYPVVFVVVATS